MMKGCIVDSRDCVKVYETIASHFSSTRHSPWPRVTEFIRQIPPGSLVADIGCGNGKYLGINRNIYMVYLSFLLSLVLCALRN